MDSNTLIDFLQRGLLLSLGLSLPTALAVAAVGALLAVLQAATQLQDQTTGTVIKLVVGAVVLAACARWIGAAVVDFTDELWRSGGFHAATPRP